MNNMKVKFKNRLLISFLLVSLVFSGCQNLSEISDKYSTSSAGYESSVQDDSSESSSNSKNNALSGKSGLTHTSYNGEPYGIISNNKPDFTNKQKKSTQIFENYSELDSLGRCGAAFANICKELMPATKRTGIGMIKPSGWQTAKYAGIVDGNYLYNRCHLIGFQLAGENANEKNLITGTRYMNVTGMLPFEDEVADYVKRTNNHVLYRVTPVYKGNNLVAEGVKMEGYSVEDKGRGVCFNVFVYNVQPKITIDYATGKSSLSGDKSENSSVSDRKNSYSSARKKVSKVQRYILNTNTKKFHLPSCSSVNDTLIKNRKSFKGDREKLIKEGYEPCKRCNP